MTGSPSGFSVCPTSCGDVLDVYPNGTGPGNPSKRNQIRNCWIYQRSVISVPADLGVFRKSLIKIEIGDCCLLEPCQIVPFTATRGSTPTNTGITGLPTDLMSNPVQKCTCLFTKIRIKQCLLFFVYFVDFVVKSVLVRCLAVLTALSDRRRSTARLTATELRRVPSVRRSPSDDPDNLARRTARFFVALQDRDHHAD